ncbi:hypothetical protein [Sulfurimonas sp.]
MKKNDCEILISKAEATYSDLENCLDNIFDEKKSKLNVVSSFFRFGFSLTKLTFNVTSCAIKNVPKAVVVVAAVKRELIEEMQTDWQKYQKEQKEIALEKKITQLVYKKSI